MKLKRTITVLLTFLLLLPALFLGASPARNQVAARRTSPFLDLQPPPLDGLQDKVRVIRDTFGVPHIFGRSDHDVYFMEGYLQATDRFFQMDFSRRQAAGTLTEMVGTGPNDQFLILDFFSRTFGLRRAAERSLSAYSPDSTALIQAFADGVNAWLDNNPLPAEYARLELTKSSVPRWSVLDSVSVTKLIAFQLSFDFGDASNTVKLFDFITAGQQGGFDGMKLYFDDIIRCAPFDPTTTIPPGQISTASFGKESKAATKKNSPVAASANSHSLVQPEALELMRKFHEKAKDLPLFNGKKNGVGSNVWAISGSKSATGVPLLANDPHLPLLSPPVFYENHLAIEGATEHPDDSRSAMNVYGVSFPGIPGIVQGFNDRIAWGSSVNPLDVTDMYQEQLIIDPGLGIPVATVYRGNPEPLTIIPEAYNANLIGDGIADDIFPVAPGPRPSGFFLIPVTLVVPRRNNGPIIGFMPTPSGQVVGISVQYSGSSATHELDTFLTWARARNLDDFQRGLKSLTGISQNWHYMDVDGNIAYFASGEMPLREDLQSGVIEGLPPIFLRDGSGSLRNEWIRNDNPPPGQSLPFEILPPQEMPHIVNPSQGFLVNGNNDPIGITLDNNQFNQLRPDGQAIYYLAPGYNGGYRAAQITKLIQQTLGAGAKFTVQDMKRIQSNVQMLDAEVMTPYIQRALAAGAQPGSPAELAQLANNAAVSEAVGRLANWDFSTPTGITEGYDASDVNGQRQPPSDSEIRNSVAATIYSVWRGQIVKNTLDATLQRVGLGIYFPDDDRSMVDLRNLLDNFATNQGRGASGLNFFDVQGVDLLPEAERDIIILQSLKNSLDLLASDAFAPAFGNSQNQLDYRWGKLHRVVFFNLGGAAIPWFNIPPGAGFTDLSPALPGISTDGGYEVIDASSNSLRASSANEFLFLGGPARRFIGEARIHGVEAKEVIPGGASGEPASPLFGNMLSKWLTNEYHGAFTRTNEVKQNQNTEVTFKPAK